MADNAVRVIARLSAKEGKGEALGRLLRGLVEPTRNEPGCRRYELWQNAEDGGEFTFVEEWAAEEALQAHFSTPHIQDALARFPELLSGGLDLRRYRLVT